MAAKGKSNKGSSKGGSRVRHDKPITVGEPVDELPPRSHSSAVSKVIDDILAKKGSWVPLDTGGRQPNSVQSMVTTAAKNRKLNITVSVRGDEVFAKAE